MVEHFCVKFDGPSCSSCWDIMWITDSQTLVKALHAWLPLA